MRRRDVAKVLVATAAGSAATLDSQAQTCTPPCFGLSKAETAAGITLGSVNTIYIPSPRVDPRRYGAFGDGKTDDTLAMQTALKVAQAGNGRVMIPDDFVMLCNPLSVTVGGLDSVTNSFAIEGASMVGSRILAKTGASAPKTPLLTIQSSNPTGTGGGSIVLQPAQVILENFSISNYNQPIVTGGHGLSLQGVGGVRASALQVLGFDSGVELINSLGCLFDQQGQCDSNNTGFSIRRVNSPAQLCNLVTLDHLRIAGNLLFGVNFSGGTQFVMRGCDLEQNGTAGFPTTGALLTGTDLGGTNGVARVELYENWFEANHGTSVNIQPLSAGLLSVAIEGGQIISAENGQALTIGGATLVNQVLLKNLYSPAASDEWQINATYLTLINTMVGKLADNAQHKSYINSLTAQGLLT